MSWFNLAGAAIGGLASVFGSTQQNRNIDKQIKAQQQENDKNRQYNLMLAKQQNQWNLDQWNRENAYNDPTAQMQRLRNAGLNPDLVYGSGSAANLSAPSPEMTAGEGSLPVDMSAIGRKRTIANSIQEAAALTETAARVSKSEKEVGSLEEDITLKQLKQEEQRFINSMKSIDESYHARNAYVSSEILTQQWHNNKEQFKLLQQEVANLSEDVVQKQIDNEFKKMHKDEYYQSIINQYKITEEELKRLQGMTNSLIRRSNAEALLAEDNYRYMKRVHDMDLKGDDLLESVIGETGYSKLFGLVIRGLWKALVSK